MRATSFALLLTASALAFAPLAQAHDGDDRGPNEDDISQTHDLQDFDAIEVRGVYRLNVTAGDDYKVFTSVGASHKPYFEAYLDQMHDVKIVSTDTVLKD